MWAIPAIGRFIAAHWVAFLIVTIVAAVCIAAELCVVWRNRPKDSAGNGITVGQPKAFDNRSLALRVERLNAGLENLKIINQNVTDNLLWNFGVWQPIVEAVNTKQVAGVERISPLLQGPDFSTIYIKKG